MCKLYLFFILISCLVMLSAAAGSAYTTQASKGRRAGTSRLANRPMKEKMGSDEQ
jgi:hypothetical protein